METPSSNRRFTRSQAKVSVTNNNIPILRKNEDSAKQIVKMDRLALIDITNDSPIVGLASGRLGTPSSLVMKRNQFKQAPGSGEALLRGQVQILLQKVEEEAAAPPLLAIKRIVDSPSGLLAPTPTNTPQMPDLSDPPVEVKSASQIYQEEEEAMLIEESWRQRTLASERSDVTRALQFDFSDFSSSCSSVLTEASVRRDKSSAAEDDDASVWSIQVNTSTRDEDEVEEIEQDEEYCKEGGLVDELCEGMVKIFVQKKLFPDFEGKHTRFVYNSDSEIEGEEEVVCGKSLSILRLNGLPMPRGKHLRFSEEEEA